MYKCIKSYYKRGVNVLQAIYAHRGIILPPAARMMAVIIRRLRWHFIYFSNIH